MRCMMTANRRASATIALFIPRRLAICIAQALSQDHFAERNSMAWDHHVQKLSQAKDFQDMIKIQTEYMQTQWSLFADQAKQLGEAYLKITAGAFKPPFNA